ncbi:sensor histidine kinase [Alicyclobacillus fodiniaquatilis]|uniref:histidine kinase n=1 Tax=Alicyclobacillus fodiniaquatilis TaxID=1661150 RepID=A0ABW4JKL4_9BACL
MLDRRSSYFGLPPVFERTFILIWVIFALSPVQQLFSAQNNIARTILGLGLLTLYLLVYVVLVCQKRPQMDTSDRIDLGFLVAMMLFSVCMTTIFGSAWIDLFYYIGTACGLRLPMRRAPWAITVIALIAFIVGASVDAGFQTIAIVVFVNFGLGFMMMGLVRMGSTIFELREARARIADFAAAEAISAERLRFARDLHDLLGHSLSLIALKSDLTSRLLDTAPDHARREIQDIESTAREALREVRQVVLNYRQPTLLEELEGAKEMLAAAGVDCEIEYAGESIPIQINAVLAWAVREAVTNVIRHAKATYCHIGIAYVNDEIRARIVNDGCIPGSTLTQSPSISGGSGLAGISDRVMAVHGKFHVDRRTDDYFCLDISIPINAKVLKE